MDSNHRTRKRADLQSAAVGHLATCPTQKSEPLVGIEPTTYWLQISCSTSWAKVACLFTITYHFVLNQQPPYSIECSTNRAKVVLFIRPATVPRFFQGYYGGRSNKELPPILRGGKGKGIWYLEKSLGWFFALIMRKKNPAGAGLNYLCCLFLFFLFYLG